MHIDQTCGVRAVQLTVRNSSCPRVRWFRPCRHPTCQHSTCLSQQALRGAGHTLHLRQQNTKLIGWRGKGEVCPQPTATAVQGGRIAGHGAYDVTDSKFSTKWGPPSCSPPV